jgi:hippurate hydrolase
MDVGVGLRSPLEAIRKFHDELTALRRDLHAHPELGFEEVRTAGIVARSLELLGIEVHRGIGKTGLVGVIRGRRCDSGRMIALRADMDALPMTEQNTFGHRSTKPGLMHGCGHDGHTAILIGVAKYLARTRNFDGTAVLIFQPAEEGLGGAKAMIEDGLFDIFPCNAIYAMHNWPGLPPGKIGINPGPMMAAADRFEIVVHGKGGHGAHPYQTIDPVVVAAHIITAAQAIVSRNVSPLDAAVVSICSVQAGHPGAMSVIPSEARLVGTVRTFRRSVQEMVETRLGHIASSIAGAFGATATLKYERIYPATINTPHEANFVADVATAMIGKENVIRDLTPSMGAEDFSFMLQGRAGAYFRVGQGGAESGCFLHNTSYDFNDAIIPVGAGVMASIVERSMPVVD